MPIETETNVHPAGLSEADLKKLRKFGVPLERSDTFLKIVETKTVGAAGGIALLFNNLSGIGIIQTAGLFQTSGWFLTSLFFILFMVISSLTSLFIVEAMQAIPGNKYWQGTVEFGTLINFYFGPKSHILGQFCLYGALQSLAMSSIIQCSQTIDNIIIDVFGKTCGLAFGTPFGGTLGQGVRSFGAGWKCVTEHGAAASPFKDTYVLVTFGYLAVFCVVVPMCLFPLADYVWVQFVSFALTFVIYSYWVIQSFITGLDISLVPFVGNTSGYAALVGVIMLNFAFVQTVPAWVNVKRPDVNVQSSIWTTTTLSLVVYMCIGMFPALAFSIPYDSNVIAVISSVSTFSKVFSYLFSLIVLMTSIPVFVIISQLNLIQNFDINKYVAVGACYWVPWILSVPFLTGEWLLKLNIWSSLIFVSTANFVVPLMIYIKAVAFRKAYNERRELSPNQRQLLTIIHHSSQEIKDHLHQIELFLKTRLEEIASHKHGVHAAPYPPSQSSPHPSSTVTPASAVESEVGTTSDGVSLLSPRPVHSNIPTFVIDSSSSISGSQSTTSNSSGSNGTPAVSHQQQTGDGVQQTTSSTLLVPQSSHKPQSPSPSGTASFVSAAASSFLSPHHHHHHTRPSAPSAASLATSFTPSATIHPPTTLTVPNHPTKTLRPASTAGHSFHTSSNMSVVSGVSGVSRKKTSLLVPLEILTNPSALGSPPSSGLASAEPTPLSASLSAGVGTAQQQQHSSHHSPLVGNVVPPPQIYVEGVDGEVGEVASLVGDPEVVSLHGLDVPLGTVMTVAADPEFEKYLFEDVPDPERDVEEVHHGEDEEGEGGVGHHGHHSHHHHHHHHHFGHGTTSLGWVSRKLSRGLSGVYELFGGKGGGHGGTMGGSDLENPHETGSAKKQLSRSTDIMLKPLNKPDPANHLPITTTVEVERLPQDTKGSTIEKADGNAVKWNIPIPKLQISTPTQASVVESEDTDLGGGDGVNDSSAQRVGEDQQHSVENLNAGPRLLTSGYCASPDIESHLSASSFPGLGTSQSVGSSDVSGGGGGHSVHDGHSVGLGIALPAATLDDTAVGPEMTLTDSSGTRVLSQGSQESPRVSDALIETVEACGSSPPEVSLLRLPTQSPAETVGGGIPSLLLTVPSVPFIGSIQPQAGSGGLSVPSSSPASSSGSMASRSPSGNSYASSAPSPYESTEPNLTLISRPVLQGVAPSSDFVASRMPSSSSSGSVGLNLGNTTSTILLVPPPTSTSGLVHRLRHGQGSPKMYQVVDHSLKERSLSTSSSYSNYMGRSKMSTRSRSPSLVLAPPLNEDFVAIVEKLPAFRSVPRWVPISPRRLAIACLVVTCLATLSNLVYVIVELVMKE
ncbi:hypothetical protein HDV05_001293 [Chytridiales sp. JEL 0842]|nr:hypothetical protein HDV05_001293 [Chytridiales sp. JEL 0842]